MAGNVLIELLQNPTEPLGVSRHSGTILADWLEEAMLSASRQKAGEIHDAIVQLYESALVKCSADVHLAIQASSEADIRLRESYQMGMLSLAQILAAQGLDRKVSSEFFEFLNDPTNMAYTAALFESSYSNKELSRIVNQTEENVSRRLRKFRELGVTSSKKIGTTVINSLTVTARQIIEELGLQVKAKAEAPLVPRRSAICAFEIKKDSSKPYMQHQIGFSRPKLELVERRRA